MLNSARDSRTVVPLFIVRASHHGLPMIGSRRPPSKHVARSVYGTRITSATDAGEPCDELLIKIASHCQWPAATLIEGVASHGDAGMKTAGGVFLLNFARVKT